MNNQTLDEATDGNAMRRVVEDLAREHGFDCVGVADPRDFVAGDERLCNYLENNWHGSMGWMEIRADERAHPTSLWADVKSVVMLGTNYGPSENPLMVLEERERAAISVYAQGSDYHDLVKKRLKRVGREFQAKHGGDLKVFVDTAPVMEKPLGQLAGLGWQGKHTNLVSKEFGSWLFLGSIFTTLEIEAEKNHEENCGSCSKCLDICPTNAFPAPFQLDARRCISYLTIEHKEHIPVEFRRPMGNRVYGCDDCLAVCPWNKFASPTKEIKFLPKPEIEGVTLEHLAGLDDTAFRALFAGSPIKRTGRDRFLRNVLIAIANSGEVSLSGACEACLKDNSALVRAMAVWALLNLIPTAQFQDMKAQHLHSETDSAVRAEWDRELGVA